jgi:Phage-related protein
MTDKFTWRVTTDSSGQGDFSTAKAQFGDGYSQEVANGLNSETQKWNVTYSNYAPKVREVLDFIRGHVGVSFLWTPPFGDEGYYRCKSWSATDQGGNYGVLTMQFEQVYAP